MPFNRAWLILPSKRVQIQKKHKHFKSILSSSLSKVVQNDYQSKEEKTVLSKSECFCENTSELKFAH